MLPADLSTLGEAECRTLDALLAGEGASKWQPFFENRALAWARELAHEAGVTLRLRSGSVFEVELDTAAYDVVVDSGCFRPEAGSGLDDAAVYAQRTLGGGLGYSEAQLRACWSLPAAPLRIEALRPMREPAEGEALFGQPFLWAMLARKI